MSFSEQAGSTWRRWEPHIHTPGTLMSDKYGQLSLEDFCKKVDESTPNIEVLGITDYFSIENYQKIVEIKNNGKYLKNVKMIFPNIELRHITQTKEGKSVNVHLMISPESQDHIYKINFLLQNIKFNYSNEEYNASPESLIQLGRKINGSKTVDEEKAKSIAVNQFKVDLFQLVKVIAQDPWYSKNVLIAVANGESDGLNGIIAEDRNNQYHTHYSELRRITHIIFASDPKTREFWLGKHPNSKGKEKEFGIPKPCLHGSDAHSPDKIGRPDKNRYCWLKGDPSFDTLKQTCLEPERARVQEESPSITENNHSITNLDVSNINWIKNKNIPLNPGLISIIGAKGAGKTALIDVISSVANADCSEDSFLKRAYKDVDNNKTAESKIRFIDGREETKQNIFSGAESNRQCLVEYISQHQIEYMSRSTKDSRNQLELELKKIVFNSIDFSEKSESNNFDELFSRNYRITYFTENDQLTIGNEISKLAGHIYDRNNFERTNQDLNESIGELQRLEGAHKLLADKSNSESWKNLESLRKELREANLNLQRNKKVKKDLEDLKKFIIGKNLEFSKECSEKFPDLEFTEGEWAEFNLKFVGNPQQIIIDKISESDGKQKELSGSGTQNTGKIYQLEKSIDEIKKQEEFPDDLLKAVSENNESIQRQKEIISSLEKKLEFLEKIDEKISSSIQLIFTLHRKKIKDIQKKKEWYLEKKKNVSKILEEYLNDLDTMDVDLTVESHISVEEWVSKIDYLFDYRKNGNFRGLATLRDELNTLLNNDENFDLNNFSNVLCNFFEENLEDLLNQIKVDNIYADKSVFDIKFKELVEWILKVDDISVGYSMVYNGIDISKLSPGTRGIALIAIYLSMSNENKNPLIMDQPEDNLDPSSIYLSLLKLIKKAKQERQIILVTHNANLVINADADQVIVAEVKANSGSFPLLKYISGGIENADIRKRVCDILEGGEVAFKERANRLRIKV